MKYTVWIALFGIFAFSPCKQATCQETVENGLSYYGERISPDGAITYDQLLQRIESVDSINNVKVSGSVDGVCQAKGCWMNIVSDTDKSKESMFVKFKNYGFFMPLDASGSTAIMEGKVYKEETSVEELRHYAEDEGKSAEEIAAITEPIVELKFMAHGVILKP